jgi:hypothetical protein
LGHGDWYVLVDMRYMVSTSRLMRDPDLVYVCYLRAEFDVFVHPW